MEPVEDLDLDNWDVIPPPGTRGFRPQSYAQNINAQSCDGHFEVVDTPSEASVAHSSADSDFTKFRKQMQAAAEYQDNSVRS